MVAEDALEFLTWMAGNKGRVPESLVVEPVVAVPPEGHPWECLAFIYKHKVMHVVVFSYRMKSVE